MPTYNELLTEIRTRPLEFLGEESCELLEVFLAGCIIGGDAIRGMLAAEPRLFEKHLLKKYSMNFSTLNGFCLIRLLAGQGAESFHLFFKEWDEFMAEHPEAVTENESFRAAVRADRRVPARELLGYIRAKPPLYLGQKSLRRLRAFFDGRAYGLKLVEPALAADFDLAGFEEWVCRQYEVPEGTRLERLGTVIEGGDERALDWFFKYYDRWIAENRSQSPA